MIIDILEGLLEDKDLCVSISNTEDGRKIFAFIEDFINEHPNQFDKCLILMKSYHQNNYNQ